MYFDSWTVHRQWQTDIWWGRVPCVGPNKLGNCYRLQSQLFDLVNLVAGSNLLIDLSTYLSIHCSGLCSLGDPSTPRVEEQQGSSTTVMPRGKNRAGLVEVQRSDRGFPGSY